MKVLILWADHQSTNLGVHALATGARELVRAVWPDAEVDFQSYGPGSAPGPPRASTLAKAIAGVDRTWVTWLRGYDVVLDTGAGDSFADIYGMRRLLEMAAVRRLAVRAGDVVMMAPQTVGPFSSRASRLVARHSLRGVRRVYARDEESLRFAGQLGIDARHATDMVFAIPRPPLQPSQDVLFNVSGLLWEPNPHADHQRYREYAATYCGWLLERGHGLTLLAHVLGSDNPDNDRPAVEALAAQLGGEVRTAIPTDLEHVRSIIATGRLVVGSRMHACLNALSIGVPALPWAYSRKFAPLLNGLGWDLSLDLRSDAAVVERSKEITERVLTTPMADQLAIVRSIADERLERLRDDLRESIG